MAKKSKKESAPKGKQPADEDKSTDSKKSKTLSGAKKSRAGTADSSAKTPSEPISTTAPPVEENKELHQREDPSKVRYTPMYQETISKQRSVISAYK